MTDAKVSFVVRYTQPSTRDGNLTKRPSIVVGGDRNALAAVQTVLSPRAAGAKMVIASPSSASVARARGAWRAKLLRCGWTGPFDVILSASGFVLSTRCYTQFLQWLAANHSLTASSPATFDPWLTQPSKPVDCSLYLFIVVNVAVVLMIKCAIKKPDVLLEAMQTSAMVLWLRMLALFLAPCVTTPASHAQLQYQGSVFVSSIPTATIVGLLLCVRRHDHAWRLCFALLAMTAMALQLLQKTHYTLDVVSAPCVVHTAHTAVVALRSSIGELLSRHSHSMIKRDNKTWTSTKPKGKLL